MPTPTPFPTVVSPIEMPDVSLWNVADDAVQAWNMAGHSTTQIIQAIVILIIIFFGLFLAIRFFASLSNPTEAEGEE